MKKINSSALTLLLLALAALASFGAFTLSFPRRLHLMLLARATAALKLGRSDLTGSISHFA